MVCSHLNKDDLVSPTSDAHCNSSVAFNISGGFLVPALGPCSNGTGATVSSRSASPGKIRLNFWFFFCSLVFFHSRSTLLQIPRASGCVTYFSRRTLLQSGVGRSIGEAEQRQSPGYWGYESKVQSTFLIYVTSKWASLYIREKSFPNLESASDRLGCKSRKPRSC